MKAEALTTLVFLAVFMAFFLGWYLGNLAPKEVISSEEIAFCQASCSTDELYSVDLHGVCTCTSNVKITPAPPSD